MTERVIPYELYLEAEPKGRTIAEYFDYLVGPGSDGSRHIGFKVLANQYDKFAEQGLQKALQNSNTKILYLTRRDPVKESISGAVARARNLYAVAKNEPRYEEKLRKINQPTEIDCASVVEEIQYINYWKPEWLNRLKDLKLQVLEIFYEDFVDRREDFHRSIQKFLEIKGASTPPMQSNFQKVISTKLSESIANYHELEQVLAKSGYKLDAN